MNPTKEQKLYTEIINKAWEDDDFKAKLVANPVATIEEFIGRKLNLPEGARMVVRDQTDENKVFINIPRGPETSQADAELNEEQLEAVAGGVEGLSCACPVGFPWPPFQLPKDIFGPLINR